MTIAKLQKGKEVLNIINAAGGTARFVGGCVRNFLLGIDFDDIDIATTLTPAQTTAAFEAKGIRVIPTGIDFGTVTAVYEKRNYEITTLRSDLSCDGRHAKVSFTKDYEADAARRDFTFNALYMDVDGMIYDFFNGQEDLKKGVVRFIGKAEERIAEDYLRILRLFRFHAYYGRGKMLQAQLDSCKTSCNGLDNISGERIRAEMIKLLSHPQCYDAVEAMAYCAVLSKITNIENIHFNFIALKKALEIYQMLQEKPEPMVMLATLLEDKNTSHIEAVLDRWRLSNKEKALFERLEESLHIDLNNEYQRRKTARINGNNEFADYVVLAYAKGSLTKMEAEKAINWAVDFKAPEFPVKSADLMALGFHGKLLGDSLRKAEEMWERAGYSLSREEILGKVRG